MTHQTRDRIPVPVTGGDGYQSVGNLYRQGLRHPQGGGAHPVFEGYAGRPSGKSDRLHPTKLHRPIYRLFPYCDGGQGGVLL